MKKSTIAFQFIFTLSVFIAFVTIMGFKSAPTPEYKEYTVVRGGSEFPKTVRNYMDDGWHLQGGVSSASIDGSITYAQAMVR